MRSEGGFESLRARHLPLGNASVDRAVDPHLSIGLKALVRPSLAATQAKFVGASSRHHGPTNPTRLTNGLISLFGTKRPVGTFPGHPAAE